MPGEGIFTPDFLIELLVYAVVGLVVGVVVSMVTDRYTFSREVDTPDGGRGWSMEVWARLQAGAHPRLRRRWRAGRAVVSHGSVELSVFKGGVRFAKHPPFVIAVAGLGSDSVQPAGWRNNLRFAASHRLVVLTTSEGARIELALPREDVEVALDVLQGRPPRARQDREQSELVGLPGWAAEREVRVLAQAVVDPAGVPVLAGDVGGQLDRCVEGVREQLAQQGLSLSALVSVTVRTDDAHEVQRHIGALGGRLREAGATPTIKMLSVNQSTVPGQLLELEATAIA